MLQPPKFDLLNGRQKVSELKDAGFIFIKMKGYNRSVNPRHVKALMKSVRETGCFLNAIQYITAEEWFRWYPDRKIVLESGKEITKDAEDIERILLILDGQNRYDADNEMGMEENYQSTLLAEHVTLPDEVSPDRWMTVVNSTSRIWDEKDRGSYIAATNPDKNTNIPVVRQMREDYRISERAAYALLNYIDSYRKSLYVDHMLHPDLALDPVLKGTPENRKRGLETLHAIEVGFRNYPKVIRNMAVIDFVLEVYSATPDNQKSATVKMLQNFLMTISENVAAEVNATKDKAERKRILHSAWIQFKETANRPESYDEFMVSVTKSEHEWSNMMEPKRKSAKNNSHLLTRSCMSYSPINQQSNDKNNH